MKRKINGKRQRKQRVSIPSSTFKRLQSKRAPKQPYVDVNGVEWDSLTICVADGLDASMDGRGFDGAHAGATRLADAAPKLLATLRDIHSWLVSPDLDPAVIEAYQRDCAIAIAEATKGLRRSPATKPHGKNIRWTAEDVETFLDL